MIDDVCDITAFLMLSETTSLIVWCLFYILRAINQYCRVANAYSSISKLIISHLSVMIGYSYCMYIHACMLDHFISTIGTLL